MTIRDLNTPAILLDLDSMERNLERYAHAASQHGKLIWPMIKTHKSLELAALQQQYGADGFLCGTLDEAEALAEKGYTNLMYAYPVATDCSIRRVIQLSRKCRFITRIDSVEAAALLNRAAEASGTVVNYTVILNSGLNRFGILPGEAAGLVQELQKYRFLRYLGISTHPGHVYAARSSEEVPACAQDEKAAIETAAEALKAIGMPPEIVSSGSTPTFFPSLSVKELQILHPGNYIFHDAIQMSIGVTEERDCALFVLASVISHPQKDVFICDAGAKCLGLDQGAHGNSAVKGYGVIRDHPELSLYGLSEEVGKIHVNAPTDLKIGDRICIIPNHSCSSANLTSYYIGIRGDIVDHLIPVDIRGNSTSKGI